MENKKYAGFGVRLVAAIIDVFILVLANSAVGYMLIAVMGDNGAFISNFLGLFVSFGYFVWYQREYKQTVGKKMMKIQVVTYDGKMPTMMTLFLREIIGKFVSGIILLIGYLMVIWDPKKQGLHDKIASTYVVYVDSPVMQPTEKTEPKAASTGDTGSAEPRDPSTSSGQEAPPMQA